LGNSLVFDNGTAIGIGTASPTELLTLFSASSSIISLRDSQVSNAYGAYIKGYGVSGSGGRLDIGVIDANVFRAAITITEQCQFINFFTNAGTLSQKMSILPNGNVIIQAGGTFTDAGYKLDVNGTGNFTGALNGTSATFSSGIATLGYTASTSYAALFNGAVGIGTISPTAKLQINSTSAGAATVAAFLVNESVTANTEVRLAFAANTNNDIATNRYSYISALNTSGSNGQALIFATNESGNSAVERLRIASTGAATFSSTLGINGVADSVKSGTYTPTLAAVYNVASSGSYVCQYMRVGSVVTVSGAVEFAATAANTWTRISISLPISSTFDASFRAGGGGAASATNNVCGIQAAAFSGTVVHLDSNPNTTGNLYYTFSFTYLIM
jgi:hypothetical protein